MIQIHKKLRHALITYEIELVEIMSGIAALSWGIWLLIPSLDSFQSGRTFEAMAMVAPEWLWGTSMMGVGFFAIQSVLAHNIRLRKMTSLTLSIMWMFITAIFAYSNLASTAAVTYGVFTFFTAWSYLRLSQRVELTSKFSK
jgi:hypothetical protein